MWEQGQSFMPFKTAVGKFLLKSHYTTANKLGLLMFGQRSTQPGCFIPKLKKKKKKISSEDLSCGRRQCLTLLKSFMTVPYTLTAASPNG